MRKALKNQMRVWAAGLLTLILALSLLCTAPAVGAAAQSSAVLTGKDMTLNSDKVSRGGIVLLPIDGNVNAFYSAQSVTGEGETVLKFTQSLYKKDNLYNDWQAAFTIRDASAGSNVVNDVTGVDHGYVLMIDNDWAMLFKNHKDDGSKVGSFSLADIYNAYTDEQQSGLPDKRAAFFAAEHSWELAARNRSDGGVDVSVTLDGTAILQFLDAQSPVKTESGFRISNNGSYLGTYSHMTLNGTNVSVLDVEAETPEKAVLDDEMLLFASGYEVQQIVSTPLIMSDSTFETKLNMTDTYGTKQWAAMFMLRDSDPGKKIEEKTADAVCYKASLEANAATGDSWIGIRNFKNGEERYSLGDIHLTDDFYNTMQQFHTLKIVTADNAETNAVDITVTFDGEKCGTVSDNRADKIAEGGLTVLTNGYTDATWKGNYFRMANFRVSTQAQSDGDEPQQVETLDFISKAPHMLAYNNNGALDKANQKIMLDKTALGNSTVYSYRDARPVENQCFDLGVSFSDTKSWLMEVNLRDKMPGWKAGDRGNDAGDSTYFFSFGVNDVALKAKKDGAVGAALATAEGLDWLAGRRHLLRFEAQTLPAGNVLRLFVDGELVLRYLDTQKLVTGGGGFTVIANTDTSWAEGRESTTASIDMLKANFEYVSEDTPDFEKCEKIDFTELVKDTQDWKGGMRDGHTGKTVFYPNALEFLEDTSNKNAAFMRDKTEFTDFVLDFKLTMLLNPDYTGSSWNLIMTFRDSNPAKNTWDKAVKNAYTLTFVTNTQSGETSVDLKRINNTASNAETGILLGGKGGLKLVSTEDAPAAHTFKIGTYNVAEGVRIAVYLDGEILFDVVDTGDLAVRTGGTFMLAHNAVENGNTIIRSIKVEGVTEGEYRDTIVIGVNEPAPDDGADLYPEDIYKEPELTEITQSGCGAAAKFSSVGLSAFAIAAVFLCFKKKEI